jgi:serine/threonine protein kinase
MASGDDSLPIGYLLSGYRIEKVLGRGGFGVTYLAREVNLDLLVAIKEYFPRDYASRSNTINIRPSGGDEDKDILTEVF